MDTPVTKQDLKNWRGYIPCHYNSAPFCPNDAAFFIDGTPYCTKHAEMIRQIIRKVLPPTMAQDWTSVARRCKRCGDHGAAEAKLARYEQLLDGSGKETLHYLIRDVLEAEQGISMAGAWTLADQVLSLVRVALAAEAQEEK